MHTTYDITVPTFIQLLGGLRNVLVKGEAFAKEKGMSEEAFLNDRLAPNMFPLKRQVQVACDQAKGCTSRLSGKVNPIMEDTEETFAELQARIDKTLAFVQSVSEKDFTSAGERKIEMKHFPAGKYLIGTDYALRHALPNFYFHVTTAYDILRKLGVPLVKADFTNEMPFRDL